MGSSANSKIPRDGLVFHFDMNNPKSWKGRPTTNLIYQYNPKTTSDSKDFSKSSNSANTNYDTNHPGRIQFYGADGTTLLSDNINTGVTDWTNTNHGNWIYDEELRKPVYQQNNRANNWKALVPRPGTFSDLGLVEGDTISVSFNQWTDNISRAIRCGLYMRRVSDSVQSFYAGYSSDGPEGYNTKPYTWQRVYKTYTIPAGMSDTYANGLYFYGHYFGTGVIKISDLQSEIGSPSLIVKNGKNIEQSRSDTECAFDLTGNYTITPTSLTYTDDGYFNLTSANNDHITTNKNLIDTSATYSFWIKRESSTNTYNMIGGQYLPYFSFRDNNTILFSYNIVGQKTLSTTNTFLNDTWYNVVFTHDYDGVNTVASIYVNGEFEVSSSHAGAQSTNSGRTFMLGGWDSSDATSFNFQGEIPIAMLYNRALSSAEIKSSFEALRNRFDI